MLEVMASMLEDIGMVVIRVWCIAEAQSLVTAGGIDLALVDARVADGSTEALCRLLTATAIPLIVTSGHPTLAMEFAASGIPFLAKPFRAARLQALVRHLLERPA